MNTCNQSSEDTGNTCPRQLVRVSAAIVETTSGVGMAWILVSGMEDTPDKVFPLKALSCKPLERTPCITHCDTTVTWAVIWVENNEKLDTVGKTVV